MHVFTLRVCFIYAYVWASLLVQLVKKQPAVQETQVRALGGRDPQEKEVASPSNVLAWKIL